MAHAVSSGKPKTDTVLYLYGLTQQSVAVPHAEGVDGEAPVEPVSCSGFVCWVSRVARSEYGEQLNERMENLDWLAMAGVRHQKVVGEIGRNADILPTRFGTVFLTEESLQQDVNRRKKELMSAFRRISGADEWGVKIFTRPESRPTIVAASGRDYLRQKAATLRKQPARTLDPQVDSFIQQLGAIAKASAPVGKVSGAQPNLEWQGSFLIARDHRRKLESLLQQFAHKLRQSHRIECTGPWPPYSFVDKHGR